METQKLYQDPREGALDELLMVGVIDEELALTIRQEDKRKLEEINTSLLPSNPLSEVLERSKNILCGLGIGALGLSGVGFSVVWIEYLMETNAPIEIMLTLGPIFAVPLVGCGVAFTMLGIKMLKNKELL